MSKLSTWTFINERLKQFRPVILLYVLESKGSSPGRQGFMMAVAEDDMSGSIGGGIMEYKFVETARERLGVLVNEPLIKRQVHNKLTSKNQSGMICSGEQTILLFSLTVKHQKTVEQIRLALSENKNGLLQITPDSISFSAEDYLKESSFSFESEKTWLYKEGIGSRNRLYIVGGGHCSLAFSKLIEGLDFYSILIEERENLNTFRNNNHVNEKIIVNTYAGLTDIVEEGQDVYIVIMTFGYRSDDMALRALIHKRVKYLGVLGSKNKMERMFEEWRLSNLPEERLRNIYAPVGISINSRTPEEIAISIAAEIISVKNK